MRIDLHTHSTFSDGTDTPTRLVLSAAQHGVSVIALCDHDTFEGIPEAVEAASRAGVQILPGVEISAHSDDNKEAHILGYGCRTKDQELNEELEKLAQSRRDRIPGIIAKLNEVGLEITEDDVRAQTMGRGTVGRPHIADAMVAKGYVKNRNEAFDKYLGKGKPAYLPRKTLEAKRAIELIHDAGGVAVLAHPMIEDRGGQVSAAAIQRYTREYGLDGIEVDHPSHDTKARELLHLLGERLGLIRTGSSDYHGTGKINHDLGVETTRPTALREILRLIEERGGVGLLPYKN